MPPLATNISMRYAPRSSPAANCGSEAMADSLVAATEGKGGSADYRRRSWRLAGPSLAVHARAGVHSRPRATADQAAGAAHREHGGPLAPAAGSGQDHRVAL